MSHPTNELPDLPFAGSFNVNDLLLLRDISSNTDYKLKVDTLIADLIKNAGNIESIDADVIANRPMAGTANRWFIATDQPRLYKDDGANWIEIFGTAIGYDEGSAANKIPTNSTRDARASTYSALQTFNAGAQIVNISINGNQISATNVDGDITLAPNGAGVVKTDIINENTTSSGVTIESVLIQNGNVDGVDVSALETDVDGFPDELKNLTADEISQLENINSVTISNTQWGYVGSFDQPLATTDNALFNTISNGTLTISSNQIDDVNGNAILNLNNVASAVNALTVSNSATGNDISVSYTGSDTNITADFSAKGSGGHQFSNGNGALLDILDSKIEAFKDLYIDSNIVHSGDTDTQIIPSSDAWDVQTGGSSRFDINNSGVRVGAQGKRIDRILNADDGGTKSTAGVTWEFAEDIADSASVGKIMQIKQFTTNTVTSTSSTSFIDTALTDLITPSDTSNDILIMVATTVQMLGPGDTDAALMRIVRDGTAVWERGVYQRGTTVDTTTTVSMVYTDSPATTSQITYTLQLRRNDSQGTVDLPGSNQDTVTLTLMEISGGLD